MLLSSRAANADAVVAKLLKHFFTGIRSEDVSAELEKHPDYPSLLSICDVLRSFNLESEAFKTSYEQLKDIPTPFLAHTKFDQSTFVLVTRINENKVTFSNEKWNNRTLSGEEFRRYFAGIAVSAEPVAEKQGKKTASKKILSVPLAWGMLAVVFLCGLVFNANFFAGLGSRVFLLSIAKGIGLVTTILLLVQTIDSDNPILQKICHIGEKANCSAILSSNAAKVSDDLSWSEVGFFYFSGTLLLLLFGGKTPFEITVLFILNILCLPYTFYSVYYQFFVEKKWCLLCCTIQATLWAEFLTMAGSVQINFATITISQVSAIIISLLIPVVFWGLVRPVLLKAQQYKPLRQQYRSLKYNSQLFNQILREQPKYSLPGEDWCIVLGNPQARHSITVATNPYCPPCAKAHDWLDHLIEQNKNLQLRIVFRVENIDDDIKTPISRHLMALNQLEDKSIVKRALNTWYQQKQKDYDTWANSYPVELDKTEFYKLDKQKEWCEMANVAATPTMFVNGHILPTIYQPQDLKYMLG
jgi:uncharacterized membrane protein